MSKSTYKSDKVRTIVAVGVFSAFAFVCCVLFHFKAAFLSFDLKDSVMTVGAMLFGPIYGLAMTLIVSLIEAATISTTGIYGLVMNIISSATFVCIGSLIYSRYRTMKGALVGMAASTVSMTAVMMVANLIITPFYMGVSTSDVAALIPTLLLPFNLTKAIFNSSLVFLIYKPISSAIRAAGFVSVSAGSDGPTSGIVSDGEKKKKTVFTSPVIIIASVAVAVISMVYFFVKLGGSFSLT
ncbi:MAG: ECF transporter S component [Eubacteriales bacterium]